MKRKTILIVLAAVFALALAAVAGGSVYLIGYALDNPGAGRRPDVAAACRNYPELRPWIDSLRRVGALRDTFVVMARTGQRAHAMYVRNPRSGGATAILVHGYTDTSAGMLQIARIYHNCLGYNVLLPDLHGHGLSDGRDIQMGWNDRLDIMEWTGHVPGLMHTQPDSVRIVVHGISMGAATTMCLSGEQTPAAVRCFVEDCGYTSVWDEFAHELRGRFGLPEFPLLYTASGMVKVRYGWTFGQASPLGQVARCRKPMLFIHGGSDTFVPTSMVYPLYRAKPQPKQLWVAPGSAHAMAYRDHRAEYTRRVVQFVGRYMHRTDSVQ